MAQEIGSLTWNTFMDVFAREILPIYQSHEERFDWAGIHGRLHASRAVIFAERLSRYYQENFNAALDINAVRFSTAFHDSGRKGNGVDLWEQDSADRCRTFLVGKGMDANRADFCATIILKHSRACLEKSLMHDADVLEIMRPCCGHGGRQGFRMKNLRFANDGDPYFDHNPEAAALRAKIVDEAWQFIHETEKIKGRLAASREYFPAVLLYLEENRIKYPFWSSIL